MKKLRQILGIVGMLGLSLGSLESLAETNSTANSSTNAIYNLEDVEAESKQVKEEPKRYIPRALRKPIRTISKQICFDKYIVDNKVRSTDWANNKNDFMVIADFNCDGRPDIAVVNHEGQLIIYENRTYTNAPSYK